MIEEMKLRNFSPATQKSYLYDDCNSKQYHRPCPDCCGKRERRILSVSQKNNWLME
jgi:hypothetical protein